MWSQMGHKHPSRTGKMNREMDAKDGRYSLIESGICNSGFRFEPCDPITFAMKRTFGDILGLGRLPPPVWYWEFGLS